MRTELKWMLLGIFLAVASVWCLLFAGGNAALSWFSVFLLVLAAGSFAGGFAGEQPREKEPPDYPMENNDTDNNKKEQET